MDITETINFAVFDALTGWNYGLAIWRDYDKVHIWEIDEMRLWCRASFGVESYCSSFTKFYFLTEQQRNWFIMRWL